MTVTLGWFTIPDSGFPYYGRLDDGAEVITEEAALAIAAKIAKEGAMAASDLRHGSLVANTTATVTIDDDGATQKVAVLHVDGAEPIVFTVDGSNPTAPATDNTKQYTVLPGGRRTVRVLTDTDTVVKLRSTAVATYEIEPA